MPSFYTNQGSNKRKARRPVGGNQWNKLIGFTYVETLLKDQRTPTQTPTGVHSLRPHSSSRKISFRAWKRQCREEGKVALSSCQTFWFHLSFEPVLWGKWTGILSYRWGNKILKVSWDLPKFGEFFFPNSTRTRIQVEVWGSEVESTVRKGLR
jgi:hypothetical protein